MLKLPSRLRLENVPEEWVRLESALRAELAQVGNAAESKSVRTAGN